MYFKYNFGLSITSAVDDLKPVTHLVAVDMSSKKGMKLLREGIRFLVMYLSTM